MNLRYLRAVSLAVQSYSTDRKDADKAFVLPVSVSRTSGWQFFPQWTVFLACWITGVCNRWFISQNLPSGCYLEVWQTAVNMLNVVGMFSSAFNCCSCNSDHILWVWICLPPLHASALLILPTQGAGCKRGAIDATICSRSSFGVWWKTETGVSWALSFYPSWVNIINEHVCSQNDKWKLYNISPFSFSFFYKIHICSFSGSTHLKQTHLTDSYLQGYVQSLPERKTLVLIAGTHAPLPSGGRNFITSN